MKTEKNVYVAPTAEVCEIQVEQTILTMSEKLVGDYPQFDEEIGLGF
jgi:hypothetical protein